MHSITDRLHVVANGADPLERGRERGAQLRDALPAGLRTYLELFAKYELDEAVVRDLALSCADAVGGWRPARLAEMDGLAAGAGVEPWHVYALNARTEILSQGVGAAPGECSTIGRRVRFADGSVRTFGLQTWDWHHQLDGEWHTHETRGGRYDVAGLTEHGMLGKIGVNSAGLALHFNILGHRTDGAGGVPVHVLSATVLEEAASVDEAVELVRDAPRSASSSFTLLDADTVVTTDITPIGVFVVEPVDGTVVRTNHFLSREAQAQEKTEIYQPDSDERYGLIAARFADYPEPRTDEELLAFLYSDPGQPLLCHRPDLTLPFGERWATLATVRLDPAARTARISNGTPIDARAGAWRQLVA
ncbi:C45 family autoproteolytic acyltransferase/hydrolase [Agromyces sp. H3Y2-19a]|uniref:C45 family autoproteolytic acyltransferase/hydolase n=1 Tax=Agromyces chromiiresistens TaxID=3030835 RepID=UPI0023B8DFD7|nr:C45 family peptidase [Agromyces chromiiresistens]MDF0514212.1 C45 family autoproteolytic acyltransferase/hydrolase [Agromyces chromiiresistens]